MQGEEKPKFRCRGCRKLLFQKYVHGGEECTSYFLHQPTWLNVDNLENQLKFNCPKCKSKIGEIIFSGKKCSCGEWITPAFQAHKNKIDCIKPM